MQLRIVCVIGLIIGICTNPIKATLDDDITKLLEEFRARMCHPFTQWGIPALDPFEISHKEAYLDNKIFKDFSASITNLRSTGLSDFIINQIKITTLTQKFTFDLTFPLTDIESVYTAQGSLAYIFNLVGNDKMLGYVDNVRVIITGGIKIGLSFGIKNLKIQVQINEVFVDFGHLIEDDRINNFFHNVINDLTIELLNDFWEDFGETYTTKIENLINQIMSGYTLREIIALISGGGSGEPIFGDDPPGDCKNQNKRNVIKPSVILREKH